MERLELKNKLKDWENAYKVIHGKKPNKADVAVAPAEIRATYNEYWKKSKKQISSVFPKMDDVKSIVSNVRLKRCDSYSDKLLPRNRSSLEMSTLSSMIEPCSPSNQDGKRLPEPVKTAPTTFDLELFRSDKSFRIEPICGFHPNLQSSSKSRPAPKDFDEDARDEIEPEPEPSNEMFAHEENADESSNLIGPKKRKKRQKSNQNFLRLDLKHKRYGTRAGKKLKGAALKRLLLKMKYKKLRKTS